MPSSPPPLDSLLGTTLQGRYRILEFVAEGAMGAVYRAERIGLERPVAVKFLSPGLAADPQGRLRFEREAKTMSRLDHPNCISVTDFGVAPDPYIVMEYVTGETLREIFDRGPLEIDRCIYICLQILAGLAHAHHHGIVHRDIKPANVMVTEAQGTEGLVRILDFGLAKLQTPTSGSDLSAPYLVIGTPSYMSPEQSLADKVDARADLYSLGVMLFEAVTGEKPFDGDEPSETLRMHRDDPVPQLSKVAPDIKFPKGLQEILETAIAKGPENRYQTATAFAESLTLLRDGTQAEGTAKVSKKSAPLALADTVKFSAARLISKTSDKSDPDATVALKPRDDRTSTAQLATHRNGGSRAILVALLVAGAGAVFLFYDPFALLPGGTVPAHDATVAHAPPDSSNRAATESTRGASDGRASEDARDLNDVEIEVLDDEVLDDEVLDDEIQDDEFQDDEMLIIDPVEVEPLEVSEPSRPIRNVKEAEALVKEGKRTEAISGLRKLRSKQPKSAYIRLLLGNLYFEQRWWSVALGEYSAAIAINRAFRKRSSISKNAIRALGSPKTRRKAQALLRKIGRTSLPYLRRAEKRAKSRTVRSQASTLIRRITRSKKPRRSR